MVPLVLDLLVLTKVLEAENRPATMRAVEITEEIEKAAAFVPSFRKSRKRPDLDPCGTDVSCMEKALRNAEVEVAILCVADFSADRPLMTVQLIDVVGGRSTSDFLEGATTQQIFDLTRELLTRAGFAGWGRVQVEVAPADAVGAVAEGKPLGPNDFLVEPGQRKVLVTKEGFGSNSASVEVRPFEISRVAVSLEEGISPWVWVGVGVGVAAIAAGVGLGIALSGNDEWMIQREEF